MSSTLSNSIGELLLSHLPADGRFLLAGPDVGEIAGYLKLSLCEPRILIETDPASFTATGAGTSDKPLHREHLDIVCFIDAFRGADRKRQSESLANARNLLVSRVLHLELQIESSDCRSEHWRLSDSLSLGYRRVANGLFGQIPWQLYEYKLFNYKSTPDWLNSKHWSNPQNWDRFRW